MPRQQMKIRPRWDLLSCSKRFVDFAPGWRVPQWAEAVHVDLNGTLPPLRVRVELAGEPDALRPVVTMMTLGDGSSPVTPTQLNFIAPGFHTVAPEVIVKVAHPTGPDSDPDAFNRAMDQARRRRAPRGQAHEDEVLAKWERDYQPKGYSQRHMADMEGMKVSTLMTYLSRARKRRGN